jgi:hypothetical protein
MSLLLIIILVLLLCGGGFYGRGRWYGRPTDYAGPAFDPMMLIWIILIVVLICWLLGSGGFHRIVL